MGTHTMVRNKRNAIILRQHLRPHGFERMTKMGLFDNFKTAVTDIRTQVDGLRMRIRELRVEIAGVRNAPPSKDDALALLERTVHQAAAGYRDALMANMAPYLRAAHDIEGGRREYSPTVLCATKRPDAPATERTMEIALLALLGNQVIDGLKRVIDSCDWPEGAISATDRTRKLGGLQRQLDEAIEAERRLVSEAEAVGILL